ncbi:hypothetical protein EYF80_010419 [Liparis tanakae]|uniref:Uncharacterized protein n=1 Tax=Liparis tanakae TaxID=230148 RepID=A0A4Z2ING1_9TELE|nr:hypothetical protein EYF80_010419 [Liparis tanakae]
MKLGKHHHDSSTIQSYRGLNVADGVMNTLHTESLSTETTAVRTASLLDVRPWQRTRTNKKLRTREEDKDQAEQEEAKEDKRKTKAKTRRTGGGGRDFKRTRKDTVQGMQQWQIRSIKAKEGKEKKPLQFELQRNA